MEATTVRRLCVAAFFLLLALPLIAADGSSILGTPTVLVYPFAVNGSAISKEAGSRLAVTIATQIANLGGVIVKPAPPGIDRPNYLDAARHEGADYYVAGYVTPLGDGVSLVEQLVSTQTGIVVYSNTAQIRTYPDAAGQGDVLRDALLRHQTRNLSAYAAPPPPTQTAAPTPEPGAANAADIGRLFGRKQKRASAPAVSPSPAGAATVGPTAATAAAPVAAPVPSATATAIAAAVARAAGYAMLPIGGPAQTDRRSFTVAAIRNVLIANHQRVATVAASDPSSCSDSGVGTLLGGNLSMRNHTILGEPQTLATLEFLAYDCAGSVVYRKTFARDSRGDWKLAVDRVVQSAVAEFLRDPAGSRRG